MPARIYRGEADVQGLLRIDERGQVLAVVFRSTSIGETQQALA